MIRKPQMISTLFMPFNVEYLLMKTNSCGNMAGYDIYLRIYHTRNLVYFCMPLLYASYHYNCTNYGLILFLFSLYLFRDACYKGLKYM